MTTESNGKKPVESITPSVESEHFHEFRVRVRTYGRPEKTINDIARTIGVAMHRAFHPDSWVMWDEHGREVLFDALAYDGEHGPTHQSVVTFKDPDANAAG